jgi:hypothetical protein
MTIEDIKKSYEELTWLSNKLAYWSSHDISQLNESYDYDYHWDNLWEAIEKLEAFEQLGVNPTDVQRALIDLEKLKKFKATFDAYELATRQGYVAYEILQEQKEMIYKLIDKSLELRNKENKTEYEKGIARGYYIALNMLGYGDE